MAVLVSGASGFLGSNLVTALASVPCSIMRLARKKDRLQPVNITSNVIDIEGDYRRPETWHNLIRDVDIVFHLAAQTSVYKAEENKGYLFNGPVNTTQQGLPVPIAYGELVVGGAVISASIKSNQ